MQYKDYLIMNHDVARFARNIGLRYSRQYSYFGKKVQRTKFYTIYVPVEDVYHIMNLLLKFSGVKDVRYHKNLFAAHLYSITVYYK